MAHDTPAHLARRLGTARNGLVRLRDFDQGMVLTLGGVLIDDSPNFNGYFLTEASGIQDLLPTTGINPIVQGPDGWPGVPIVFSMPEDKNARYKVPMVLLRRDSISPAMQRWNVGSRQYKQQGGRGAIAKTVNVGSTANPNLKTGFTTIEEKSQAIPYDILYTIRVVSKFRGQTGQTAHVNALIEHVMKRFQPYCEIIVPDSVGDLRGYWGFSDVVGTSDESFEIADRVLGFDISVRVEAELDLDDPRTSKAVTHNPVITYQNIEED